MELLDLSVVHLLDKKIIILATREYTA
nr:unnamed protein product [Callosobruchus chinensis]